MRLLALIFSLVVSTRAALAPTKIVCFYDNEAHKREDSGKYLTADLEHALAQCTHIVYGYAKLDADTFKIKSDDTDVDANSITGNYKAVTALKKRFPGLQILLSIGGWADKDDTKSEKYLTLLRDPVHRATFISSAQALVSKYGFDGLDLAWQFPLIRIKERGFFSNVWHNIKKTVGATKGNKDELAAYHKTGFTALVKDLKKAFRADGYQLTASVIPHTNYTLYYDLREISPHLEAIHVLAYDYLTPERKITPEVADYPAPLYPSYDRNPQFNVDYQIRWFLNNGAPANKIVLGIPTYGRSWKLSAATSGTPPIEADGEGEEGHLIHRRGILSFPEICSISQNPNNAGLKGLLKKVSDPNQKLGTYAYRSEGDREGLWVGYEEPATVRQKADYARNTNLAGVALVDITLDDFRGVCFGDKYPLLKAAKGAFS